MPRRSVLQTHRGFIFSHEGDPRVAASITMAGVIAVLLGGVFMAIGPPLKTSSSLGRKTFGQPEPAAVRMVGRAPRAASGRGPTVIHPGRGQSERLQRLLDRLARSPVAPADPLGAQGNHVLRDAREEVA